MKDAIWRRTRWRSKAGQAAGGAESLDGGGNGGLGVFAAALHHAGDQVVVVGGVDLDDVAIFPPPAVHKETVRRNGRDRHLWHDFSLAPSKTDYADYRTIG